MALREYLVEQRGNAPRATILQGSSAPLCLPHGAQSRFRAALSEASTRRFHQISLLSEIGADRESRTPAASVAHSPTAVIFYPRYWCLVRVTIPASSQASVLQTAQRPQLHTEACWSRVPESNRLSPGYESGMVIRSTHPLDGARLELSRVRGVHPACTELDGGWRRSRTPHPKVPRFSRPLPAHAGFTIQIHDSA
jgi:hypothetical protein